MMRKYFLLVSVVAVLFSCSTVKKQATGESNAILPDVHTSRVALDWQGVYRGMLPCASCEGIKTQLELFDSTYVLSTQYSGKGDSIYVSTGRFIWSQSGNSLVLIDTLFTDSLHYKIAENQVIQLDKDGNEIKSGLRNMYVLQKDTEQLVDKMWQLTALQGKQLTANYSVFPQPYIIFYADNKVGGSGGCNRFFGNYMLSATSHIGFSAIGSTRRACFESMDVENEFLSIFHQIDTYSLKQDTLHLLSKEGNILATFHYHYFSNLMQ